MGHLKPGRVVDGAAIGRIADAQQMGRDRPRSDVLGAAPVAAARAGHALLVADGECDEARNLAHAY